MRSRSNKIFKSKSVDLIFLDIHMPDFTGFDFIQTIKITQSYSCLRIKIFIEAFEYECIVDYLVKPITQIVLKAIQK
jgi:response regulator of citrate/malate metabolism